MKVALIVLILLLLMPAFRLSYCQSGLEEDPYYEQFKDKHFAQEKQSALINLLYLVFGGLIVWFAYYFIAGRSDAGGIKVFFVLIVLSMLVPIVGFSVQVSSLTAKENISRFSKNPDSTIKSRPLRYGMTQQEVRSKWGSPREITHRFDEEIWFYCRLVPKVDFRFAGTAYWFCQVRGWQEVRPVSLIFRSGSLVGSLPETILRK